MIRNIFSVVILSMSFTVIAQAEIYRCPAADGQFVFTDKPCIEGERRVGGSWVNMREEAQRKLDEEEAKANARRYAQEQQPKSTRSYTPSRSRSAEEERRRSDSTRIERSRATRTEDERVKKAHTLLLYIIGKCGHLSGSAEDRCVDSVRNELSEEGKVYFDYLDR